MGELQVKRVGYDLRTLSLFADFLAQIKRKKEEKKNNFDLSRYGFIYNVIKKINDEYNKEYCIKEIASSYNISHCLFIQLFKMATGQTPSKYIHMLRMEKAKNLLADTFLYITEIAEIVGYNDQLYFSRRFKKEYGCSPKTYRSDEQS
ncbi:MAG TPA: hypothetical protein DCY35_09515 [Prolixibacteraceae bacterium]|nr:hypothetical protein [Prolixibacteraceae bacterium]